MVETEPLPAKMRSGRPSRFGSRTKKPIQLEKKEGGCGIGTAVNAPAPLPYNTCTDPSNVASEGSFPLLVGKKATSVCPSASKSAVTMCKWLGYPAAVTPGANAPPPCPAKNCTPRERGRPVATSV